MRWIKKVGYRLSHVPLWCLYAITIFVVLGVIGFWYTSFFSNLLVTEQKYEQSVQMLEQQKVLLPDMQYQVTLLKQKNDLLHNDLRAELLKFGITDSYVQRERLLIDIDESGLCILSFAPTEGKKKSLYEKSLLELKTVGTFDQVCNFLRRLNDCRMPMMFKKTTIQKKDRALVFDSTLAFYAFQREK